MPTNPIAPIEPVDGMLTETLRQMNRGAALGKLSAELREVVESVQATGKPGALKLTINVQPRDMEGGAVGVTCDSTVKLPKKPMPASTFFVGDGGALLRNPPNQTELPLQAMPTPAVATPAPTPTAQAQ